MPLPNTPERIAAKIVAQTERSPSGCLLWTGRTRPDGYVPIIVGGKNRNMHRVAYELAKGPIPDGLEIDHRCHTQDPTCRSGDACPHRRCLNPDHLEAVTHAENNRRAGKRAATCGYGHEFTPENTRIHAHGWRVCLTCRRIAGRAYRARRRKATPAAPKAVTTHCQAGHPYDEANTYAFKGVRHCRICRRAADARYKARKRDA